MNIKTLLMEKGFTKYKLAKLSGVSQTTIADICSGRSKISNCTGETLYKIAKTLGVSMESLVADECRYRPSFEIFKSNVCHAVKDMGDLNFMIDILESGTIRELFERKWYPESLYLLAMVDYLSRENGFPLCSEYDDLRCAKLQRILYPTGVLVLCAAFKNDEPKAESLREAIPEFLRHNIVEAEVRNVC
jgi:transcriptional regulator with XRE-family HTH domain